MRAGPKAQADLHPVQRIGQEHRRLAGYHGDPLPGRSRSP